MARHVSLLTTRILPSSQLVHSAQAWYAVPLTPIRIMRILRETADGMAFIHSHDVIHRDLKGVNKQRNGRIRISISQVPNCVYVCACMCVCYCVYAAVCMLLCVCCCVYAAVYMLLCVCCCCILHAAAAAAAAASAAYCCCTDNKLTALRISKLTALLFTRQEHPPQQDRRSENR
jgi:hypothetical protein